MKKILLYAYCAVLVGALASCGGSSEKGDAESEETVEAVECVVTPKTKSISGPLGKAYEVVEREYKVKGQFGPEINVEITLVDPSGFPKGFDGNKVGTRNDEGKAQYPMIANFTIEFLDEDGDIVDTATPIGEYGELLRLTQGDTSTLSFYAPDYNLEDIKYFRIKSDYYPNEIKESEKESTTSADVSVVDDEFNKALEEAGRVAETAGKMVEQAGEVMKELNNLTR